MTKRRRKSLSYRDKMIEEYSSLSRDELEDILFNNKTDDGLIDEFLELDNPDNYKRLIHNTRKYKVSNTRKKAKSGKKRKRKKRKKSQDNKK